MRVCKCINQGVRRIAEPNGKSFKYFLKKEKHVKRMSFIIQFTIVILLPVVENFFVKCLTNKGFLAFQGIDKTKAAIRVFYKESC